MLIAVEYRYDTSRGESKTAPVIINLHHVSTIACGANGMAIIRWNDTDHAQLTLTTAYDAFVAQLRAKGYLGA